MSIRRGRTPAAALLERIADGVSATEVDELLESALASEVGPTLVTDSVTDPRRFRARLEDSCQIGTHEMERTFSLHYPTDPTCERARIVCLVRPVKGRKLRGFSAVGRQGARLRVLGHNERRIAIMRMLLELLGDASEQSGRPPGASDEWAEVLAHFVLCRPRRLSTAARDQLEGRVAHLLTAVFDGELQDCEARRRLIRASVLAVTRDPVLVEVQADEEGLIAYTQLDVYGDRVKRAGDDASSRFKRQLAKLGRALGCIPNYVELSNYKRDQSSDYALEVTVPRGNFVAEVSSAEHRLPVRGLGTRRVVYEPALTDAQASELSTRVLAITIKQMPSGALFRSVALALLVLGVMAAVILSGPRFDGDPSMTTALEVLSWSTGIASVAFIATWAVLLHTVEGMAFEPSAVLSALVSSGLLVALIGVLAHRPETQAVLLALLAVASLNAILIGVCLTKRLNEARTIAKRDAVTDPEGPQA